jgi:hypothetical protein
MFTLMGKAAGLCLAVASLAMAGASAALAGPYIGGDLTLDLDEQGNAVIIAANVRMSGRVAGNVTGFAADVTSSADVRGNVRLFAANVFLSGASHGDVRILGADITVSGPIGGDFEVAGANVAVHDVVAGDADIAGAIVTIHEDAVIRGDAAMAGSEIVIRGVIGESARLAGRDVRISGYIAGPVEIRGEIVRFDAGARFDGPVTVRSPNPPILADGVEIAELTHEVASWEGVNRRGRGSPKIKFDFWPSGWAIGGVLAASAFTLGLLISIMAPGSVHRLAYEFRQRPWVSGFLGLIVLALLPILGMTLFTLLVMTIIGIPLAFLLVFAFPIVLFLAFAFGGIAIGDLALNRSGKQAGFGLRAGSFLVVFLLIGLLSVIPVMGFIIGPVVLCIGLGAWTLAIFSRKRPDLGGEAAV